VKIKNPLTQYIEKYTQQKVIKHLKSLQIMKSSNRKIMVCKSQIVAFLEVLVLSKLLYLNYEKLLSKQYTISLQHVLFCN
jgi:predicted glycosyltransferase involved in capsule biosynthesis